MTVARHPASSQRGRGYDYATFASESLERRFRSCALKMLMTASVCGVSARTLVAGLCSVGCSRVTGARCAPEYVVAVADMPPAALPEVFQRLECRRPCPPSSGLADTRGPSSIGFLSMTPSSGTEYPRYGKILVTPLGECTAEASRYYRSIGWQKLIKNEQFVSPVISRDYDRTG
jgi:hypothetical protein